MGMWISNIVLLILFAPDAEGLPLRKGGYHTDIFMSLVGSQRDHINMFREAYNATAVSFVDENLTLGECGSIDFDKCVLLQWLSIRDCYRQIQGVEHSKGNYTWIYRTRT